MHETAIAQSIIDTTIKTLSQQGETRRVSRIGFETGILQAIMPDALEFAFDALKKEYPVLRDAILDFKILPVEAYCARCAAHHKLDRIELLCPDCGAPLEIEGGREMTITFVEVFDV